MVRAGSAKRALVVAAEYFTSGVDYRDPESAYFFGDAAAAVVLETPTSPPGRPATRSSTSRVARCRARRSRPGIAGTGPLHAQAVAGDAAADASPATRPTAGSTRTGPPSTAT